MKTIKNPNTIDNIIKIDLREISKSSHCPNCGKTTLYKYRPFCSRRCTEIDLGHWLNEDYRVPLNDYDNIEDLENEDSD